ncbi:hypothetical protein Ahy_B03g062052 [Arachis hypogaea]|uniref:Uncharacterized protein n=1 Tax=Arachis hypogaea TaxID=3818 RepID=A0A444ZSU9_ARAHY|nr:hypothetical protein Ahy_B03g062052 [Arachis hypogaea]
MNSNSEENFEATYEASDEDEDGNVGGEATVKNVVVPPAVSKPMKVSPFMRSLDLNTMYAPEFFEYANIGAANPEDWEFRIRIEYSSRKSMSQQLEVILSLEGSTKMFMSPSHKCFMQNARRMIVGATDLSEPDLYGKKLDSDTVVEAIRPLIETNPSRKVKSIIAEVQSKFNYTISYRKVWVFKILHLQKLVNIGYLRTVEEYNINYKRLQERGEAYTRWYDAIGVRNWVLAFDEGH